MDQEQTSSRAAAHLERMAYRVKEAAEVLAISRSRFYELVSAGEIRILKQGARTLVRHSELQAYLDRLEAASTPRLAGGKSP